MQSKNPTISAYAIVHRATDDRFLIVERQSRGQKVFDLPAGTRKPGEKMVATVARVVTEELAMYFVPQHYIGFEHHLFDGIDGERVCNLRSTFSGTVADADASGSDNRLKTDSTALWMSISELVADRDQLHTRDVLVRLCEYAAGIRQSLDICGEVDE
jgi:ADP-ribose pyrophosphatase YjhB (NUDIX family)